MKSEKNLNQKVLITGMGLICSLGKNRAQVLEALSKNKSGLGKIKSIKNLEKLRSNIGGEVNFGEDFEFGKIDPNEKLARLAIEEAILDSQIDFETFERKRCGLIYGTCDGNLRTIEHLYKNFERKHEKLTELYSSLYSIFNFINEKYGVFGPKFIFVNGCAASNSAIGFAFEILKFGTVDSCIVAGSDSLAETTLAGFNSLQALSENGASPFSENAGISLGDGAGALILETEESALKRNAKIYAEILGYDSSSDAYHVTSPEPTGAGLKQAMSRALEISALTKNDVKVICAHGTGTEANDFAETNAIKKCFGENAKNLEITSTKSFCGHTLGASGITQAVIMVDSMQKNKVPPILNFQKNRVGCDLNYTKNISKNINYENFISNSLAFGGNNVSTIFAKYKKDREQKEFYPTEKDKIVVTGFSAITPEIKNKDDFFEILKQNKKNIPSGKIKSFNNFELSAGFKSFRRFPLTSQLGIESVNQALIDANYALKNPEDLGVLSSVYKAGLNVFEENYFNILENGLESASAIDFPNIVLNSTLGSISKALNIRGFSSVVWGDYSPFAAIFYAGLLLKRSRQNIFAISGIDTTSRYDQKILDSSQVKNYDFCEGASSLILENFRHAKERDARIYAELSGFAMNSFNAENVKDKKKSYLDCLDKSLEISELSLDEIDLHVTNFRAENVFKNTISSQDFIGNLETSSSLFDIGMGIFNFEEKLMKNIIFSAQTLNGTNFSFVMKKI